MASINLLKGSKARRQQIEAIAQEYEIAEVEFDPIGPTAVYGDKLLRVSAPFYPFVGKRALSATIRVIEANIKEK